MENLLSLFRSWPIHFGNVTVGNQPTWAPHHSKPGQSLLIPQDGISFVESEEDGSPKYYLAHYVHWEWPAGSSGPTCGVGYDCGYVTVEELKADWTGIVSDGTIEKMLLAVGKRGVAAEQFVRAHKNDITITWDQANQEFVEREIPKWIKRIDAVLPHFDDLPGDCKACLFSVSYNRGTGGYDDPRSARDAEMREIKQHLASKDFAMTAEYLAPIGHLIDSMKRLWPPSTSDLWRRREHEAALWAQGVATLVPKK